MARARARCLAQFMVILDVTIVNVALPTIQADLEMSERAALPWVVRRTRWSSAGSCCWAAGGRPRRPADRVPHRPRLFTTASLVCGARRRAGRRSSSPARAAGRGRGARPPRPCHRHHRVSEGAGAEQGARERGPPSRPASAPSASSSAACSTETLRGRGLLRQRPGRHRLTALGGARVEGRARLQELRRRGCGGRHARACRARLRDRAGVRGVGLGVLLGCWASSRSPLVLLVAFVLIELLLRGAPRSALDLLGEYRARLRTSLRSSSPRGSFFECRHALRAAGT